MPCLLLGMPLQLLHAWLSDVLLVFTPTSEAVHAVQVLPCQQVLTYRRGCFAMPDAILLAANDNPMAQHCARTIGQGDEGLSKV
jgi:hypothetical protein